MVEDQRSTKTSTPPCCPWPSLTTVNVPAANRPVQDPCIFCTCAKELRVFSLAVVVMPWRRLLLLLLMLRRQPLWWLNRGGAQSCVLLWLSILRLLLVDQYASRLARIQSARALRALCRLRTSKAGLVGWFVRIDMVRHRFLGWFGWVSSRLSQKFAGVIDPLVS